MAEDKTICDIEDQLNKMFKQNQTNQFTFSFLEKQNIINSENKMLDKLLKYDFKNMIANKQKGLYTKDYKINDQSKNNPVMKLGNGF